MAKSAAMKAPAAGAAESPIGAAAPKSKKGLVIMILLVLVLAGGGAGGWFWWKVQNAKSSKNGADDHDVKEKRVLEDVKKNPPQFVQLEQFTVNLQDATNEHYLQIGMVLEVDTSATGDAIKLYMPVIRNRVLLLLSSKHSREVSTLEGKQALAAAVLEEIREPLPSKALKKGIEGVHFSAFVIQ